ncbi:MULTISPECIES: ribosome-inactivating family protein [Photorhabdus]|uniref:rRNA N-glycosylase n=2 Tax=Photorhabdus TaxID=29487 RepID=A0ABX0B4F5_9GAMM|nr:MULTISPECIES: ribosome-inactivating family protein [Photorhabdus]PQQ38602.1 hypothetical protein C6H68_06100 [Photorhabdus luminescens]MCC8373442.1 hypothetical protein [Photorhabdus bodei]MCT8353421.1 ribosome-inactivating family protein [Photorhabdus kayaii]MDB6369678.1 ribosome-inactivating family protein [Photorhabdus bodei]NDL13026.1 hypothetical protein [Photorhabdus kayaii]
MKNFYRYLILFFFLFSNVVYSKSVNFDYSDAQNYIKSIKNLRSIVGSHLPNVPGLLVLNPTEPYTSVHLISNNGDVIDLILSNTNLYMVGFVSAGIFYRFNDTEFSNITVPETNLLNLNISSSYIDLFRRANRTREETIVSNETINSAITTLWRQNGSGTVEPLAARAFMTLITAVAESARFSRISSFITSNYDNNVQIGGGLVRLTNRWSSLSSYAYEMSNNAGSNAGYFDDIVNSINRNRLYGVLALALYCDFSTSSKLKPRLLTFSETTPLTADTCSSERDITLINNIYWPNNVLQAVFD